MSPNDMLLTVAELSLALAGFSGVVVGIRGATSGSVPRQDAFGLVHILASSGAALVFSLLPTALHAAGLAEESAWTLTSGSLGALVLVAAGLWAVATTHTKPRHPPVFWSFVASGVVLGAALLATSTGLVPIPGSLLPLALLWLLGVGFAQFVTFLTLSWAPRE